MVAQSRTLVSSLARWAEQQEHVNVTCVNDLTSLSGKLLVLMEDGILLSCRFSRYEPDAPGGTIDTDSEVFIPMQQISTITRTPVFAPVGATGATTGKNAPAALQPGGTYVAGQHDDWAGTKGSNAKIEAGR